MVLPISNWDDSQQNYLKHSRILVNKRGMTVNLQQTFCFISLYMERKTRGKGEGSIGCRSLSFRDWGIPAFPEWNLTQEKPSSSPVVETLCFILLYESLHSTLRVVSLALHFRGIFDKVPHQPWYFIRLCYQFISHTDLSIKIVPCLKSSFCFQYVSENFNLSCINKLGVLLWREIKLILSHVIFE